MPDANISIALIGLFVGWLLLCGFTDLRWRKLPNALTLGAYLPALIAIVFLHQSLLGASVSSALMGWLLALILTLPAYAVRWLGAGDVKMFSAVGLMTGWQFSLLSFVLAGLLAGAVTLLWLFLQRSMPYLNLKLNRWDHQMPAIPVLQGRVLPFGTMLAAGALTALGWQFTSTMT